MSIANTNVVAKIAAVVAGLGLVAMSFAPVAKADTASDLQAQIASLLAQIAALQAQSGSAQGSATVTFSRDLTLGSTGADVTALQNWLISKGFTIAAGATGYFGAQSAAALASYQASVGISPAAGYFGPVTRAKVNAAGGSTGSTGGSTGGTSTGGLSGGEADIDNSYSLVAGDDLAEGDTDSEIAVAKFEVKNGDARIQRVTVELTATSGGSESKLPWKYIDTLSVFNGSKKIGDVNAGSKSDWDKSSNTYSIDIPVDSIVREDDKVELSIRADAQGSIDGTDETQQFDVVVPTDGIRAIDSQGIQQYTGDDSESVSLGFVAAESGDLTVRKASDNPDAGVLVADANDTSSEFDVLNFEIRNKDNADVTLNSLTFDVATTTVSASPAKLSTILRKVTLDLDGETYTGTINNASKTVVFDNMDATISSDDTVAGTITVTLFGQTGHYAASGETIKFSLVGNTTKVDAEGTDTGDTTTSLGGSAIGEVQSISIDAGINVSGNSDNAVLTYNSNDTTKSYGTYTLKFDVTADGDDVYVPKTVASSTNLLAAVGVAIDTNLNTTFVGTSTVSMSSTADSDGTGPSYVVHDGDTETFTVTVTLDPNATGTFAVGVDKIRFSTSASLSSLQTLEVDQTKSELSTDALSIQN